MAKLDEIAELLTEEIKGFENSVNRMEELKAFLMTYKIQADTSDIDFIWLFRSDGATCFGQTVPL